VGMFAFETSFDLVKTLIALKISPLLVSQFLRVANSCMLPPAKCPSLLWPFNLSRIPAPLANQIMSVLSRLIGS
jgi:hypothetical protein